MMLGGVKPIEILPSGGLAILLNFWLSGGGGNVL